MQLPPENYWYIPTPYYVTPPRCQACLVEHGYFFSRL
jgi:hypothetical protein